MHPQQHQQHQVVGIRLKVEKVGIACAGCSSRYAKLAATAQALRTHQYPLQRYTSCNLPSRPPPPPPIPFHPRYSSAPATLHPMRKRAKGTQRKGIPFLPPDRAPLAPPANFYFVYRAEHAISPMYFHRSL